MKFLGFCNRAIEYLFYSLFLLVPLVFAGNTSELFEFNKMWTTYIVAIGIAFFWFSKMIILKKPVFKRTLLDIPIFLFLISQIISTLLTLDMHVSFWGYYSRFNGGLLSIITYIFLYYAFVSNLFNNEGVTVVKRSLLVSIISGFLVVLWAIPSHFGYDPTCLIFRGHLDVSCWTNDFQPKIRIFGPLGQPDWIAGYLGVLLPISAAFILNQLRKSKDLLNPRLVFHTLSFILFYIALLYSGSRSGIASTIISLIFFGLFYVGLNRKSLEVIKNKFTFAIIGIIIVISFFIGVQAPVLNKFSFAEVQKILTKPALLSPSVKTSGVNTPIPNKQPASTQELGGSSSWEIRKIVWTGAINIWRANPVFGTGVETYAFAYYKYRPIEHNRVSEWNFLYNKAHNEYLNYLATTGIVGLFTYLLFIAFFLFLAFVNLFNKKVKPIKYIGAFKADEKWNPKDPLLLALLTSFLSILIINFFGFSVVILNIYLLLIPAFVLILLNLVKGERIEAAKNAYISYAQWIGVSFFGMIGLFMLFMLVRFWYGDVKYALGANYSGAGQYQVAYPLLQDAVKLRNEPVFRDQLAVNDSALAATLALQRASDSASTVQALAAEALGSSEKLTTQYPNNIVFWKSRVRILYTLANIDPRFLPMALVAIKKTSELAPTDASILYNLGVLYGQNGDPKNAVEVLEKTVTYRPDYREAHFALAVFYHELAVDSVGKIKDLNYHKKAIDRLNYILKYILPTDAQSKQFLDQWTKEQ